ncbi:uncharacterized protein L969DRAFT_59159 [Mixia osmundae IAM 14324]|uniref:PPPDE domain-containing protein n=1 Tax=Mixia osmundae (strain CBS 9802 / IAM 14324 / JCM 22182 / KY 12970) TaxID=764103 RepID=G7E6C5_MIXOS|nr:uncharacterized protein L969DRAFT_59159 [Mixia osmundae IAM 14324]KEI40458.1 hypothetical protein L969DRAFT_59159 [Mixia osmundae IAM 14324]GAA98385.1 hypothetical protein E5Q_05071 [Mixia osmundae IAM 14324]
MERDTPVRIELAVYDLLPESRLASLAFAAGVGIYHSAIRIPSIGLEFAFGGHPQPGTSGLFALPIVANDQAPLPGLRFVRSIHMGDVIAEPVPSEAQNKRYMPYDTSSGSRQHLLPSRSTSPNDKPDHSTRSRSLERVLRIIDGFKRDQDWTGTSYNLITANCNHASDELAFRLTGRHAPGWINRAAWLGLQFPCLVPQGWVEPPPAPDDVIDSVQTGVQVTREPEAFVALSYASLAAKG